MLVVVVLVVLMAIVVSMMEIGKSLTRLKINMPNMGTHKGDDKWAASSSSKCAGAGAMKRSSHGKR